MNHKVDNHAYYDHYKRNTLGTIVLACVLSAVVMGGAMLLLWQLNTNVDPLYIIVLGVATTLLINTIAGILIFAGASKPHQLLAQAIAHVSDDPVVTPPPDITAKKYERSGLKAMIQTVYQLAAGSSNTSQQSALGLPQVAAIFEELAKDMPCGLIALGKDGHVLYANALAPVRDAPEGGKTPTLLFDQTDTLQQWLMNSDTNKVRDTRLWQRIADKLPGEHDRRIFDIAAYYQKDNPAGVAAIVVAFDRTAIYQKDQEDMDFIALAAHELRGPITVIRGYLDVMQNDLHDKFTQDQQELFDRLLVSSERLAGYVNNILNVSRYDRKQFTLHLNQENLVEVLRPLVPDLALRARTQHRRLIFRIPAGLPNIAADRSSLGEVVTNLIDNAIKYSHEGGDVVVTAKLKDNDWIEVDVQDFGIGIPESVVGGLFNKFYRSHRSRQSVGGTGLGLYICKAIVEMHGGSIWVSSQEGKGSTFGFTVPTYASVAAKLQSGNNQNNDIVQRPEGWIKNHAMYRR